MFGPLDVSVAFEPGRVLVGPAGLLVSRVVYVKEGATRRIVILDAAMNDLIRPALYDAWHELIPVQRTQAGRPARRLADLVGPICESGDTFGNGRDLPMVGEDELVALANAGAYGAVMSSTYNSRLLVPEVLVSGNRFAVIRKRPTYDELLALDSVPDWLGPRAGERVRVPHDRPRRTRRAPGDPPAAGAGSAGLGAAVALGVAGAVRHRRVRGRDACSTCCRAAPDPACVTARRRLPRR